MEAIKVAVLVLVAIVIAPAVVHGFVIEPNRHKMLEFLRSQYVEGVGLLRAAVRTYPDNTTVYVANDNVLAARALAVLGDYELSSKILAKLNNEYGGGFNGKVDILLGVDIPDQFNTTRYEDLGEVGGYRIVYEKQGDRVMEDWYEYSDLLVYRALDRLLGGSRLHAELLFLNLTRMWSGYGFRDKAFNGVYATYKCALFVYLYRSLEASGSDVVRDHYHVKNRCIEIIAFAQDPITGGIRTDYRVENGRIVVEGDANVETTSMVVLALYSDYPLEIAKRVRQPSPVAKTCEYARAVGYVILIIVIATFIFRFIIMKVYINLLKRRLATP